MEQAGALIEFFMNVLGQSKADAERNAALQLRQEGLRDWTNIATPELSALDLQQQDGSEYGGIQEDPRLRQYQMQALEGLGETVASKGMTAEDAAAYNRARQAAGSIDSGLRGAAESQAAQRGMGGSTASLMSALSAGQAGVNRSSQMGTDAASDARQRYMQALNSLGDSSGQMRGQEYGIASRRAEAQDAINRFNTGMRWQNAMHNQGLSQQNFENQMGLAGGRSNAYNSTASAYDRRGDTAEKTAAKWGGATKNLWNGMAGGGWGGLSGMLGG